MQPIAYHRFPPEVIRHAVWLYFRFNLRLRDVEDLLAERGIDVRTTRSTGLSPWIDAPARLAASANPRA